jgi:hypothetical protein
LRYPARYKKRDLALCHDVADRIRQEQAAKKTDKKASAQ